MPQLIAMVIVVVGAMIYMFQTFGGTGDKIEGIAQKTSVITEINNIKNGLQLAVRSGDVSKTTTLKDLADLEYFADQINNELSDNTGTTVSTAGTVNTYAAISFGSEDGKGMLISLVLPSTTALNTATARPGFYVDLSQGSLNSNAGFLEKQILSDLSATASIDTYASSPTYKALDADGDISTPATTPTANETDGKFVIYFKDIQSGLIKE